MCHSLTASYIRTKHKTDAAIPVCQLYEVLFCIETFHCSIYIILYYDDEGNKH